MRGLLEICCGDTDSVKAAVAGGSDRIELCSALEVGGLTPSAGLITMALNLAKDVKINVLIRPREGDFLYNEDEVEVMIHDIQTSRELGVNGVVIGALDSEGGIDTPTCQRLIDAAGNLSITFHRAFDMCKDPIKALDTLIEMGCDRVLTSGCAPSALQGVETLKTLQEMSAGRINILAGSGVNPTNATQILKQTGVHELHASARTTKTSTMKFRNDAVSMGSTDFDEYARKITDTEIVRQLSNIVHNL
ncbi:MAG: copper homeostasis protein CutC [Firmicutes bacterium]|nr:copper homeostasis protein CutC [Bacillota bacterium]MCM1401554.1 copper homeostasis protein CutC [Bacteroides sp.]MCM1477248.1 copper homeostasis protein CutC [Bacteroides sp.]